MSTRPFRKARDSITGELIPGESKKDFNKSTEMESWRKCFGGFCCNNPSMEFSALSDEIHALKDTISRLTQEKEMWRTKYNEAFENHNLYEQAALKLDREGNRDQHRQDLHNLSLFPLPCSSPSKRTKSSASELDEPLRIYRAPHWLHASAGPGEIFNDRASKNA